MKKLLMAIFILTFIASVNAEICSSTVELNTDCNIATQLIDSSNQPVLDATCDANLMMPDASFAFQNNQLAHWQNGIYTIETDANFSVTGNYLFSVFCLDGTDKYIGSTEYTVAISTEASDADSCEISIAGKRSKKGDFWVFSASGFNSQRQSTGLTPTIDIFDLDSGVKTINQANMSESADVSGLYTHYFNGVLLPANYSLTVSFDANCSHTEAFEVEETFREETEPEPEIEVGQFSLAAIAPIIGAFALIAILILLVALYIKRKRGRIL